MYHWQADCWISNTPCISLTIRAMGSDVGEMREWWWWWFTLMSRFGDASRWRRGYWRGKHGMADQVNHASRDDMMRMVLLLVMVGTIQGEWRLTEKRAKRLLFWRRRAVFTQRTLLLNWGLESAPMATTDRDGCRHFLAVVEAMWLCLSLYSIKWVSLSLRDQSGIGTVRFDTHRHTHTHTTLTLPPNGACLVICRCPAVFVSLHHITLVCSTLIPDSMNHFPLGVTLVGVHCAGVGQFCPGKGKLKRTRTSFFCANSWF